ncbi:MAG: hypothetical protein KGZ81_07230 [Flavobacteriales bacterium]|nr:hypothetical protein [Flavobacteriales bacterium]
MVEIIDLDDLNPNPNNPRKINDHDFNALKNSVARFGDLSGIVFNEATGMLVGGHQRTEAFRALEGNKKVQITTRLEQPNSVGTVAIGYVTFKDEHYAYRVVRWDEATEKAANIAANRISGEWDMELLAEWDSWLLENNPDLLEATGQTKGEVERLLGLEEASEDSPESNPNRMKLDLTERQYEIVQKAIAIMRTKRNFSGEANRDLEANALTAICEDYLAVNDVDNQEVSS